MPTLYEITGRYSELLDRLYDPDMPEEVVFDTLESIEGEMKDKAENIAAVMGNLKADIAAIKADEERQAKRRKPLENKLERLESYLLGAMVRTGNTKFETPRFRIAIRNNAESVDIQDEAAIPADYKREIPAKYEPDKALIKTALKDGFQVPGCALKRTKSLSIK